MSAPGNPFDMVCPKCGRDDCIDVLAEVWLRLVSDGADANLSAFGDQSWEEESECMCAACDFSDTVAQFMKPKGDAE